MAGNEWINGYLEAILDSGASGKDEHKPTPANLREGVHFNPTKYFVEEVVTGVDESDLHRTWIKVVATRNTRERSSRLENMCWRIWHLARKKKQVLLISSSGPAHSPSLPYYVCLCICVRYRMRWLYRLYRRCLSSKNLFRVKGDSWFFILPYNCLLLLFRFLRKWAFLISQGSM